MNFSFLRKRMKKDDEGSASSKISYCAVSASDVGIVRNNNEDRVFFAGDNNGLINSKDFLGIIADGMGGHKGGEIASQMAIDIIPQVLFDSNQSYETALRKAFKIANEKIFKSSNEVDNFSGMGTTCTTVVLNNSDLYLAHVGDSRAYLVNTEEILRLSNDHTLVQELLDQGLINTEQAANHPKRNIVTHAMGTSKTIAPHLQYFRSLLQEEDLIFLCTDGLHEYLNDEEIQSILLSQTMVQASKTLVATAIERGGHDNISLLIIGKNKPTGKEGVSVI